MNQQHIASHPLIVDLCTKKIQIFINNTIFLMNEKLMYNKRDEEILKYSMS